MHFYVRSHWAKIYEIGLTSAILAGLFFILFSLGACARAPYRNSDDAMRLAAVEEIVDDLPLEPLLEGLAREIETLSRNPKQVHLKFGSKTIARDEYLESLSTLLHFGRQTSSKPEFLNYLQQNFDFLEVYGSPDWGDVFITSYYEPVLQGSLTASERFSQPLYLKPDDLITLDLAVFNPKFSDERKLRGRIKGRSLVPYHSRSDIDVGLALKNRKLEICWVDPVDAFFLHIQGSGIVRLEDGTELRLNYAEKNGQPYQAIGQFLKEVIPAPITMDKIRTHLNALSVDERHKILNLNPSYIFFQILPHNALTYLGVPATAGRTIATDAKIFPKGALGYLKFEKPVFPSQESNDATFEPSSRLVLDQDIGGAIAGPGRVDLFWGRGDDAGKHAGVMQGRGTLYYLFPKMAP